MQYDFGFEGWLTHILYKVYSKSSKRSAHSDVHKNINFRDRQVQCHSRGRCCPLLEQDNSEILIHLVFMPCICDEIMDVVFSQTSLLCDLFLLGGYKKNTKIAMYCSASIHICIICIFFVPPFLSLPPVN